MVTLKKYLSAILVVALFSQSLFAQVHLGPVEATSVPYVSSVAVDEAVADQRTLLMRGISYLVGHINGLISVTFALVMMIFFTHILPEVPPEAPDVLSTEVNCFLKDFFSVLASGALLGTTVYYFLSFLESWLDEYRLSHSSVKM